MAGRRDGSTREFARRLRTRRKRLNWTRGDLAEKMDVSVATVGNWEREKGFPTLRTRKKLCELLGKTAEELHLPPFNDSDP